MNALPLAPLLVLPLLEIFLLVLFGYRYGLGWTAAEVFGSSLFGMMVLRRGGMRSILQANERLRSGADSPDDVLQQLLLSIGGLLLVIPGLATDAIGLALLLPPVRQRIGRRWVAGGEVFRYRARYESMSPGPGEEGAPRPDAGGQRPERSRPSGGDIIEGEFRRED